MLNGSIKPYIYTLNKDGGTDNAAYWNLRYFPPPDFHGTKVFEYKITEPDGTFSTKHKTANGSVYNGNATITIIVNPVNDPPIVPDEKWVTTYEEQPIKIELTAEDPDNNNVNFSIVNQPPNGSVSLSIEGGRTFATYTPDEDFYGLLSAMDPNILGHFNDDELGDTTGMSPHGWVLGGNTTSGQNWDERFGAGYHSQEIVNIAAVGLPQIPGFTQAYHVTAGGNPQCQVDGYPGCWGGLATGMGIDFTIPILYQALVYVNSGCVIFGNLNSANVAQQCPTNGEWVWITSYDPTWSIANTNTGLHLYACSDGSNNCDGMTGNWNPDVYDTEGEVADFYVAAFQAIKNIGPTYTNLINNGSFEHWNQESIHFELNVNSDGNPNQELADNWETAIWSGDYWSYERVEGYPYGEDLNPFALKMTMGGNSADSSLPCCGMTQSLTLVNGQTYQLDFDIKTNASVSNFKVDGLFVTSDGGFLRVDDYVENYQTNQWMHVAATGTYIGNGDTKLDFYRSGNAQENDYWIYDNVSLVALESYPQPIGYIGTQTVNLQPDSFSYKANDGAADSNIGVVKINVIGKKEGLPEDIKKTIKTIEKKNFK